MNTITSRIFISAATVLWAASVQGAAPKGSQDCVIEEVKVPSQPYVLAASITKIGDVAGTGNWSDPEQAIGFFQRSGETTFLPPSTSVSSANAAGTLVGYVRPSGSLGDAFKWMNGNFTLLPKGASRTAFAVDINAHGLIVGSCDGLACYWNGDHLEARLLKGFESSQANAVNNAGVIVGRGLNTDGPEKCVKWEAGNPTVLPSGDSSWCEASAINHRGEIAGTIWDGQGSRAVLWRGNVMSYLGSEPEKIGRVNAISASGVVVGNESLDGESTVAVYWRGGKQHLLDDLQCVKRSGWKLSTANSISSAGIVGEGSKPNGGWGAYRLRGVFNE